jgi:hypothetical protein
MKPLLQLPFISNRIINQPLRRSTRFWLGLSLLFAFVYGLWVWQQAFGSEFVVQDDARQHVFWMQRFVDPALFPQDLIADYFQSVAPTGYTNLYRWVSWLGIEPLLLSKLLPPILGLISTAACFGIALQLFPVPIAAFLSTLLLNQVLWMQDDLSSATPRAFVYPLFLGFCYFLLRRSLLPCVLMIVLQGLFYPQAVFLSAGLLALQLVEWQSFRPRLVRNETDYWFCGIGLAISLAVMLPYALHLSQFDPVVTLAQAQQMPEFGRGGRSDFFNDDPWRFWVTGPRSGLLPYISRLPELLFAALLLPLLPLWPRQFPLTRRIQPQIILIPQLLLVSLFWFLAAHALLFRLHLPSRYTQHTLRIVLCWAAAIAVVILLDGLRRWATWSTARWKTGLAIGVMGLMAAALLFYPGYTPEFPRTNYVVGTQPDLYRFLQQRPSNTLIASLSVEASNLPSFAQRSVYVAREYAIPYHMGYYLPFQQRVKNLINAQYSPSLPRLKRFIRETGVDFWLLDRQAFTPEYLEESWVRQYPVAKRLALRTLRQGRTPALAETINACRVFQNMDFILLDAVCILEQPNQP